MRKILIAAAAGLMTLGALPATAGVADQARPYNQDNSVRPDRHDGPTNGPMSGPGRGGDRYGRWDDNWGRRPDGPPRGWGRNNDWYRHVRACSQRYRSYNPRTDSYVARRGVYVRCRL